MGDNRISIDEGIPNFLLVVNRVPLTKAQRERLKTMRKNERGERKMKQDHRLPKTMTPEAWKLLREIEQIAAAKSKAKFKTLREKHA